MKKKVVILYGGRSVEHDVSVNSARNIYVYIDKTRYDVGLIGIAKNGAWFMQREVTSDIEMGTPLSLALNAQCPEFIDTLGNRFQFDLVFPILHGTNGEDGSIQGLAHAMNMPIVGTGILGSAMSMSKIYTKKILSQSGINVTPYTYAHRRDNPQPTFTQLVRHLGSPFMIKSSGLGSSVGVHKVSSEKEFIAAVQDAYKYDHYVLFEKFIKAREIECAILGNYPPQAAHPGEIVINAKHDFYTFQAKYIDTDGVSAIPKAMLTAAVEANIKDIAIKTFQALQCRDFARVDLFYTDSGELYVNEVNTIPGFTDISMYPMMWKTEGLSFSELISKLIECALERHAEDDKIEFNFASELNV